jgi:hypothetical protein
MADKPEDQFSPAEIVLRMNNAVRRALSTPPKRHKETVGKSERMTVPAKSRIKKTVRLKPKKP